ncbi:MAG: hypothetical protein II200_03730 [Bacteroidaceae bacterium]|nr:hypothetical protein [Bacteroidaceae bacterium]
MVHPPLPLPVGNTRSNTGNQRGNTVPYNYMAVSPAMRPGLASLRGS